MLLKFFFNKIKIYYVLVVSIYYMIFCFCLLFLDSRNIVEKVNFVLQQHASQWESETQKKKIFISCNENWMN